MNALEREVIKKYSSWLDFKFIVEIISAQKKSWQS